MNALRIPNRLTAIALLMLAVLLAAPSPAETQPNDGKPVQFVTSKDGTRIAYDKIGKGPALILIGGALSARDGAADLARSLAPQFTVYSYDRRGRGDSTDTQPYSVSREIEDLAALIDAAGGAVFVYGKSSGASLALEATAALNGKVKKLAVYEPPYSDAQGAATEWKEFKSELDRFLIAGRNADAVIYFLKFVGAPDDVIAGMKASPAWQSMEAMAPTLAYDNALLGDDRSVPVSVASKIEVPTLVMDGGASLKAMPFMRPTADTLARTIPNAERKTLDGQAHDVSAKVVAPILATFFIGS